MKRLFIIIASIVLLFAPLTAQTDRTASGTILHCWCWSFTTIKAAMPEIAAAGFTALQTSPINTCHVGENGGRSLMSTDGTGKWYYHYQPTDWQIGNYQLGTRDEFKAMCDEAKKYHIAVIVDVLPNHTAPLSNESRKELAHLFSIVGGEQNLYHENGFRGIIRWDDRYQCTTGEMGGLPDVNTENPLFQEYFLRFMNDAIACGAGGFRFDTAKHIGLPDDPKDKKSAQNNFWPIVTGKESVNGVSLANAQRLFIYGEIIQGKNTREKDYAAYIRETASNYGKKLRMCIKSNDLDARQLTPLYDEAPADRLVTWVESHDTYANAGESAKLTNFQIRAGWAVIAARKAGTPLFLSRPQGAEATQFPGVSKIGDRGNDQFKNPEVTAVNAFRTALSGESETLSNGKNTSVLFIERGTKGLVIINMGTTAYTLHEKTSLKKGTYTDHAHGGTYRVFFGKIRGTIAPQQIAVIY